MICINCGKDTYLVDGEYCVECIPLDLIEVTGEHKKDNTVQTKPSLNHKIKSNE